VFQRRPFLVEDLGSTNSTYLNRQKVAGPMVMHAGDKMQIGNTVMGLRDPTRVGPLDVVRPAENEDFLFTANASTSSPTAWAAAR
jgi:pSer/pThr/pTyr-binding forkhead associated (FHA) protein